MAGKIFSPGVKPSVLELAAADRSLAGTPRRLTPSPKKTESVGAKAALGSGLRARAPHLSAPTKSGGVALFKAAEVSAQADIELATKLRKYLSKSTGDVLSDTQVAYLVKNLKAAPKVGEKTVQLLLHLLEHARAKDPGAWRKLFGALQKHAAPLRSILTVERTVTVLHNLAGKLGAHGKIGIEDANKLMALGLLQEIPDLDVRRALEDVRRFYPITKSASELMGITLRATPIAPPKPWTFFFYMASENNLEPYALKDVNDMERAISKIAKFANVVVLTDGGLVSKDDEDLGPVPAKAWPSRTRLLLIEPEEGPADEAIISREIPIPHDHPLGLRFQDGKGELNLGAGPTLKASLDFVMDGFPSDSFFMSVWSHGLAWKGAGEDTSTVKDGDLLRPDEIKAALSDLKRSIDVMGFDACLMANSGVGLLLSELGVGYMIGSEELLDATGWGYKTVFESLAKAEAKSGKLTPESLAHTLVDHASGTTLSAVRLADAGAIWDRIEDLGKTLMASGGRANPKLQALFEALPRYGTNGIDPESGSKEPVDEDEGLVDVVHLCRELKAEFGENSAIGKAAATLEKQTLAATRHKNQPSEYYPGIEDRSHGLTLYLPKEASDFSPKYVGSISPWKDRAPSWVKLIRGQ